MKPLWRYINSGYKSASENMKMDIAILDNSIETLSVPVLRIYQWNPPAVSLGRYQDTSGIDLDYCNKNKIDIVKRPTGGRAVFHQGDITYCFVVNQELIEEGHSVNKSYYEISSALITGLKKLGLDGLDISSSGRAYTKYNACMAVTTGADVIYNGKKVAGSAQLRKNNYILQHGSVLIEQDFSRTARIFNISEELLNCVNLGEVVKEDLTYEILSESIKEGFESYFSVKFSEETCI